MRSVYLVQHAHDLDGREEIKIVGIYNSRNEAALAVRRLRRRPGFRHYPKGFHIDRYEIGKDRWAEGFVSAKN